MIARAAGADALVLVPRGEGELGPAASAPLPQARLNAGPSSLRRGERRRGEHSSTAA